MTVDRNILPGMKPTRHSFRCGQPLGPGVAHHGMRNLVQHAQAHVASPRGERLPAQVADHLSDHLWANTGLKRYFLRNGGQSADNRDFTVCIIRCVYRAELIFGRLVYYVSL